MRTSLTILGLESSCDDTAAAVLRIEGDAPTILSSIVHGQNDLHAAYGGIVPEIAARAHAEKLDICVKAALNKANTPLSKIDAVAVTAGPGLIGGVLSGVMCAKGIAAGAGLPLIGVNHLAGHALTPRLTDGIAYPYLMLLASGGHCQFLEVRGLGDYRRLGSTIDDAVGEAFDKTAKTLGLGFPGGPAVERLAEGGNPDAFALPRPLLNRPGLDMSFAGLKTAVARAAAEDTMSDDRMKDLCASFQTAVTDILATKAALALEAFDPGGDGAKRFVVAGGVAANKAIRAALDEVAKSAGARLIAPPLRHCTDNAAMIALAGAERLAAGLVEGEAGDLGTGARPRWPLDEAAAKSAPVYGTGRRGAKA